MKPKRTIYLRVDILALDDVILFLLTRNADHFFEKNNLINLRMLDNEYHDLVLLYEELSILDFSGLHEQ